MELNKNKVEERSPSYGADRFLQSTEDRGMVRLPYLFVENSNNLMCVIGRDGYLKKISTSFCQALGYTKEELASRPFREFLTTSSPADPFPGNERIYYFDLSFYRKDGERIHVRWRIIPDIMENAILITGWKK